MPEADRFGHAMFMKYTPLGVLAIMFLAGACDAVSKDQQANDEAQRRSADSLLRSVEARCIACEDELLHAFAAGDTSGWSDCVAEELVEHATLPVIIPSSGLKGWKERVMMDRTAFPDLSFTVLSRSVEGDVSFLHYNLKGTNSGPLGPVPPTGRTIDINGVMVLRWKNGKAVEHWDYPDIALLMRQLNPPAARSQGSDMPEKP